jgi:hypothetical protein
MLRIALTVRAEAVEDVLDAVLPLVPQGVHPADVGDYVELAMYGDDLPSRPSWRRWRVTRSSASRSRRRPRTRATGGGCSGEHGMWVGGWWCGLRTPRARRPACRSW